MTIRSITTLLVTAAIALGSVNFANAAVAGRGNGGGGPPPANNPSTPDGGSDDSFKVFLGDQPDCNRMSVAAVRCSTLPPHPRRRVFLQSDPTRCTAVDYRRIVLPSGRVAIDQRSSKIRYCDDMHTMQ